MNAPKARPTNIGAAIQTICPASLSWQGHLVGLRVEQPINVAHGQIDIRDPVGVRNPD